ncbi:MAG: prephenate dehydrogenase/arogenate dehydrogenase family protein [Nitrospinae bacterium]|nr:prephenate dehydrogenase/arogenate dehydrogenase family protein [Nitrospinota bacterium]
MAGVGLIGGSLALAGKDAGIFKTVVGLGRSRETLGKALALKIIDEASQDHNEAVKGADLFFAAAPVESIIPLCLSVAPHLPDGCIITDGGSVKGAIVRELDEKLPKHVRFVGGHPIAGTEKSGPDAAFSTLYKNRYTVLTPTQNTDPEALLKVRKMWESVGSIVVEMTPEDHDEALALISHLPHLAAYALVDTLDGADKEGAIRRFVAGGFRDTTRIAASHPAMWRDIFSMNREMILEAVGKYEKSLGELKQMIAGGDFDSLEKRLDKIAGVRKGMEGKRV